LHTVGSKTAQFLYMLKKKKTVQV